ncbi:cyclic nucleotide-binding domain-containing protein [Hyalangium versicolor]|uniref:cyclic nucleotide-binding domain-containing protein n=1 Tax=Hyalangium versicolor TaxID=2861190 RepID=UPI001CCB747D|nr:cyclic nucleotide-binding domain-containing protein [Hyalangium versicolor]
MPRIVSTEIITLNELSDVKRRELADALFAIHQQVFDVSEKESFAKFVVESKAEHTWLQVHKNEAGEIVGYFALHVFERCLDGQPVAVFRAAAGSLRAYRGDSITMRFGLRRLLRYMLKNPGRKAYYLGALVHPSSYTLVAHHFGTIWPQRERETPPELLAFMNSLAGEFSLKRVNPEQPLVRHVGWRPRDTEVERDYWRNCDKPAARFFLEANPGYVEGHGLLTMVPLSLANVIHMVRAVAQRRLRQPLEAARRMARRLPGAARLRRASMVRQLQSTPLFARFDEQALESLAMSAEEFALPAGQFVFREGDSSDEMYLLARGAAYVLVESSAAETVVDEMGSGTMFGEIAMLAREHRSASIRTASASTLVRIPRSVLLPVMEAHARMRQMVWRTFARRRFDDLVRENPRYGSLDRQERLAWLQQGEHRELAAREALRVKEGTSLLVLTAPVEFEQEGLRMVTRGSMLVDVRQPLQVVARERAQLILLPRRAAAG